jgi:hypothetical protein
MGVSAMDPVNEQLGAGTGYGATGRLPGVQRTLTKVSNRCCFPAMSPFSCPLPAGRCVNCAGVGPYTWRLTTMGKRLSGMGYDEQTNGRQWPMGYKNGVERLTRFRYGVYVDRCRPRRRRWHSTADTPSNGTAALRPLGRG